MDLLGRYSNRETLLRSLISASDPERRGRPIPPARARKQHHTKLAEPEIDVLVSAYENGLSLEELASAFSIDRRTAGNHLKRRGVATRAERSPMNRSRKLWSSATMVGRWRGSPRGSPSTRRASDTDSFGAASPCDQGPDADAIGSQIGRCGVRA